VDPDALLEAVLTAGVSAPDLATLRARLLDLVLAAVPADVAVLHALSPRVPLETAALRGITLAALAATLPRWDAAAVALGPLRERATALGGVARDTDAFPAQGAARARYASEVAGIVGAGHTLVAHLVVRERIVSAALLFRARRRGAFTDAEAATLRRVAPAMALADALHQGLDATPQRPVPTRLRCEDQRLTARQREIVELVAMGHTNGAIAAALSVSPNTLRNHLAEVFRRLGASNRADVVRLAVLAT
jgi:DNA-binding CsgD family transcriptional regulator